MPYAKPKQRHLNCGGQEERRRSMRFPMNIKTEYCHFKDERTGEGLQEGYILNVSKTGLFLTAATPLELGSTVVLMFDMRWEDIEVPVGIMGTVVREEPDRYEITGREYGYGVKFCSPRMAM